MHYEIQVVSPHQVSKFSLRGVLFMVFIQIVVQVTGNLQFSLREPGQQTGSLWNPQFLN